MENIKTDYESKFIGRDHLFQTLEKAWDSYRILGVVGLKGIGKSRATKELINRKLSNLQKLKKAIKHIVIDIRYFSEGEQLYDIICRELKINLPKEICENEIYINSICELISGSPGVLFVILFDNAEDVIDGLFGHEFLTFIDDHLAELTNTKIFITSTTQVQFDRCHDSYFSFELEPLHPLEASALLDSVAPHVDFGEYKNTIIKLCEGLPLVILMVGYELSEDNGLIEAHEMVELLSSCRLRALSREFYPSEDRVGDVYRNFIERLTATFKSRLAVLQYIPGSFDVREATEMLDSENNSAIEEDTLRTLRQRSFLSYDSGKNRFSIQGIIRECLEVYCHIKNLPDIRKRYCKLFSVVLEKLCTDFYSSEYASAVSMFMLEQPNLQKLLIEVNHSKEDTYQYFMQVAASCTEFLDKFLTTESEKFYDGCLALASSYGKTKDMATVYIAIGSMYTNAKGEYATGEQNYRKALQHIARDDVTVQNATVHQRLGWNLYKRGNYMKAYKCLMQAYKTEKSLKMYNTSLRRQTLNSLGLVCADLGQFEEARRFLEENLQYLKTVGNQHWSLGCNYDNFGTLYELKGDDESAMKYYKKALKIKVSTTATNLSVVISLTNIANIYMKMDELPKAAEFSDRAMVKVRESQFPNKEALSLAYNTLGKVCLASGDFQKACELLEQAVEIRELNSPGGEFHIESLILLAKAKYKLHRYNDAIRNLKTVLDFRERFKKLYPSKFHIVECLENLYTIYEEIGESDSVIIILEDLQVELMRLERVFMCTSDDRRKQTIDVKLQYLKQYFMSFQCQKLQISNVSNSGKCS